METKTLYDRADERFLSIQEDVLTFLRSRGIRAWTFRYLFIGKKNYIMLLQCALCANISKALIYSEQKHFCEYIDALIHAHARFTRVRFLL